MIQMHVVVVKDEDLSYGPFYTLQAANDFVVENDKGYVLPLMTPPEQAGPREAAHRIVGEEPSDIQAIKRLRQEHPVGLHEAKGLIGEARRQRRGEF